MGYRESLIPPKAGMLDSVSMEKKADNKRLLRIRPRGPAKPGRFPNAARPENVVGADFFKGLVALRFASDN